MRKKFNIINTLQKLPAQQHGAVLLVMLVILIMGGTAMLLNSLNSVTPKLARDKVTADALAQAKEALIGYATSKKFTSATYPDRPGDLPCPDNHPLGDTNEGSPSTPCNSNALGRLPWKKLGLPELRDGNGELLWYAVSTNFKNSDRIDILNSDTLGTISVFSSEGTLLNDGGGTSGAVAVVISPGEALTREDSSTPQDRSNTGFNMEKNYLDTPYTTANPRDNAAFIDGSSTDGFIQGKIQIYDTSSKTYRTILNDQMLIITRENIMQPVQKRVAQEAILALNKYFCGDNNVSSTGECINSGGGNRYYPRPAEFTDTDCLGYAAISSVPVTDSACASSATSNRGRIPAHPATPWGISSILRGSPTNNWFQANGWREIIYYSVSPICSDGTINCNGSGSYLNVNMTSASGVVIATGSAIGTQTHSGASAATTLSNYLEGENISPLDDAYTKNSIVTPFNDITFTIP